MSNPHLFHFETTAWGLVRDVQRNDGPEFAAAVNRFASRYWRPVFYFLRMRGHGLHEAEDLTQEFFLTFFERQWIDRADPARGRFRTYLLTILTRFVADRTSSRAPRQRQFDDRMVDLSTLVGDTERKFEAPGGLIPERVFMQEWARATVRTVVDQVRRWCDESGRPDWFEVFSLHHFPPHGAAKLSQQAIAERFGLSRDRVRYALEETNRRFISFLRQELADQFDTPGELDAEIAELSELLGNE